MRYLCLVYHDGAEDSVTEGAAPRTDDAELCRPGQVLAAAPLQPARSAVTVRVRGGVVAVADGPCAGASAGLGGFYLLEARDLNEAIRLAAQLPPARLGTMEVRPLAERDDGCRLRVPGCRFQVLIAQPATRNP